MNGITAASTLQDPGGRPCAADALADRRGEGSHRGGVRRQAEYHLGPFRCEQPSARRGASLYDHRPALRARRDVERPQGAEIAAFVIDVVDLGRVGARTPCSRSSTSASGSQLSQRFAVTSRNSSARS